MLQCRQSSGLHTLQHAVVGKHQLKLVYAAKVNSLLVL